MAFRHVGVQALACSGDRLKPELQLKHPCAETTARVRQSPGPVVIRPTSLPPICQVNLAGQAARKSSSPFPAETAKAEPRVPDTFPSDCRALHPAAAPAPGLSRA